MREHSPAAMQPRFHGSHRNPHAHRNFTVAQLVNVEQSDRLPQFFRQFRQRRLQDLPRLRALESGSRMFRYDGGFAACEHHGIERDVCLVSPRPPVMIDQQIFRHQVEPCDKRKLIRAKTPECAVNAQEHFLGEILRLTFAASKPAAPGIDMSRVPANQLIPCPFIPFLAIADELILPFPNIFETINLHRFRVHHNRRLARS